MSFKVIGLLALAYFGISSAHPFTGNEIDSDEDLIDLSHLGNGIYGEPNSETGDIIAQYNPEQNEANPEELGNYLEGDMLMPKAMARNGLTATTARWPGGKVPFEIKGSFGENNLFI